MQLHNTNIAGCYLIQPNIFSDHRGNFIKYFEFDEYKNHGLVTQFAEEYYTTSKHKVIRGMHLQLPPHDHIKIVNCVYGEIFDVVVDLRINSPTYKKSMAFSLSQENAKMVYISAGLAHGFFVKSNEAVVCYKVTTKYAPQYDTGIRWDSLVDIHWPEKNPVISDRDQSFVGLDEFVSPFK